MIQAISAFSCLKPLVEVCESAYVVVGLVCSRRGLMIGLGSDVHSHACF